MRIGTAALASLLLAAPALALEAGDLLVGVDTSLLLVDPDTGAIELLSPDPSFGVLPSTISGVAATAGGDEIFIALAGLSLPGGSVWRVDPESGARTLIAELAPGRSPGGIAIDVAGDLLVPHASGVSRIDPASGSESVVGSLPPAALPTGIAVEASGDLLVSLYEPLSLGLSRVVRVEPGVGGFSGVAGLRGGRFSGIAIEAGGSVLVSVSPSGLQIGPPFPPAVLRIDPESGARELVSSFGLIGSPTDLAVESSGEIVVSDASAVLSTGDVVRVDPQDGSQALLVEDPALQGASAIAVVRPEVVIDIRPSHVALPSHRTLSVVLFGSEDLDVTQVDPASLAFGPAGAAPVQTLRAGRRGAAHPDLLLLFRAAETGLEPGDTQACLSGSTPRFAFEACDAIRVLGAAAAPQPRRRRSSFSR